MVQTTDLNLPGAGDSGPGADEGEPAGARERLIEAAAHLFAEQGFATVSTRALARAADVNLSAITYHFGGKENLYRAVIQRLIDGVAPQRRMLIAYMRDGVAAADGDREALARLAAGFVARLLGVLLSDRMPRWRIALMMREINQPTAAFDLVMGEHIGPLQDAVAELVAAATGGKADDRETRLLTQSVVGQCLLFALGKAVVLHRLDWEDYTPARIQQVIDTVTPAVLAALTLPLPGPGEG